MTISAEVFTVLSGYAGLQALVANSDSPTTYRIFPHIMPQDSTMPAVVFHKVAGTREVPISSTGNNQVTNPRIRVHSFSKSLTQAESVDEQVRMAMEAATAFTAIPVFELQDYEPDTKLYHVLSDYSVWYRY